MPLTRVGWIPPMLEAKVELGHQEISDVSRRSSDSGVKRAGAPLLLLLGTALCVQVRSWHQQRGSEPAPLSLMLEGGSAGAQCWQERNWTGADGVSRTLCVSGFAMHERGSRLIGAGDAVPWRLTFSSGHTATGSLGDTSWVQDYGSSPVLVRHEQGGESFNGRCPPIMDARTFLAAGLLPRFQRELHQLNKTVYFTSGHHLIVPDMGPQGTGKMLFEAFIENEGVERVQIARLRRNRLSNAFSFASTFGRGPCGCKPTRRGEPECKDQRCNLHSMTVPGFTFCPSFDVNLCLPVPPEVWELLSIFQQYLWTIDEAECRWRRLLLGYSSLSYLEVNWDEELSEQHFEVFGRWLAVNVSQTVFINPHVSNGTERNTSQWNAEDVDYQRKMQYSTEVIDYLNPRVQEFVHQSMQ